VRARACRGLNVGHDISLGAGVGVGVVDIRRARTSVYLFSK
jgi:hypothetical protein